MIGNRQMHLHATMLLNAEKEQLIYYIQLTDEIVNVRYENNKWNVSNKDNVFDDYKEDVLEEEKRKELE